jgi:hypothetical protein
VSCALAGLSVAALTSALVGLALGCYVALSVPTPQLGTHFLGIAATILVAVSVGTVVGTTPAILIICVSRARLAPWRAVPLLATGATLGLIIIGVPWSLFKATEDLPYLAIGMPVVGAIAGGALATRFVSKTPTAGPAWPTAAVLGFVMGLVAGVTVLKFVTNQLFQHFGAFGPSSSVPWYIAIAAFVVYLIAASIGFAAAIKKIVWTRQRFLKGAASGVFASVFVTIGIVLFVFLSTR